MWKWKQTVSYYVTGNLWLKQQLKQATNHFKEVVLMFVIALCKVD